MYIKGVAGTTYKDIDSSPPAFLNYENTIIEFRNIHDLGPMSMIEPKYPDKFYSSGIENIILYGNKDQLSDEGYCGINIPDISIQQRSQTVFRNIIIFQVKGTGFYGGIGQHELFLEWVTAFSCDGDGFVLKGGDIKGYRIASGNNGGVGIVLPGCGDSGFATGSGRFFDCDSWSNIKGVEIADSMGYFFFGLTLNLNRRGGLYIHSTRNGYPPGNIQIFRGAFSQNSQEENGDFSDILLYGERDGVGPYDIALFGCEFHGDGEKRKLPRHAIEDNSDYPRRCLVNGGFFDMDNYSTKQFSNKPQAVRDSFIYTKSDFLSQFELSYNWSDSDYELDKDTIDGFLIVNTGLSDRKVTLPETAKTSRGRVFYIVRQDDDARFNVVIQPSGNDTINGTHSPIEIDGQYKNQTYMIVRTDGRDWSAIKIS